MATSQDVSVGPDWKKVAEDTSDTVWIQCIVEDPSQITYRVAVVDVDGEPTAKGHRLRGDKEIAGRANLLGAGFVYMKVEGGITAEFEITTEYSIPA